MFLVERCRICKCKNVSDDENETGYVMIILLVVKKILEKELQ